VRSLATSSIAVNHPGWQFRIVQANNVSIFAFGSGDANAGIVPKNLHFAHFTLDMNNTIGAAYGLAIACCQDVTLDNLHFKNQKNGAKSMLFFGVSANASGAFIPRHLLANNCIFSDSDAQWETVTLAQSLDCKFVNCIFRDKTAIYSFLNYGSYDVACVACEFANCSTGVNGHGDTTFSGCNFFGSSVTVQADNTIFIGCSFRNILNSYSGGIKFLGYETTSNQQGWDETGSNVPVILKGNKVIGCNFDHCNTVAIQAFTFTGATTGQHLSCKDLTIIGCKFAHSYWQGIDVKAERLVIRDCESYNNGQLGSGTVKYNYVIGAKVGVFVNNHSYDDQGTPTVTHDFFIDNQLSGSVLPTMDLTFRDCSFEVGSIPIYYTGSAFTSTKPSNITLRGTNNLGINPELTYTQGSVTGAVTFDRKNGRTIAATLTGNLTPTLAVGIFDGEELNLELTQDATGGRTCAKPVNSKVPGGTLPISTGANARDVYRFRWDGSAWLLVGYQLNLS